nr:uncharacterized protein LOC109784623 [Aegilops tauschii subsp. strangulata]
MAGAEATVGRSDFADGNGAGSGTPERSILVDRDDYILAGPSTPSYGSERSILDRDDGDDYILDRDDYIRQMLRRGALTRPYRGITNAFARVLPLAVAKILRALALQETPGLLILGKQSAPSR